MSEELSSGNSANLLEQETVYSILGRIAVYDNIRSIPRIIELSYDSITRFLDETPQKIYSISHELGGKIPYTIIKEVVENLIHANFVEIIITILNNGNHIIVSDQGPGITDKEKAFLPGFTSATSVMKKYIRGVGSGLPIVKETIFFSGGSVDITDNIKKGTVISLKIGDNNDKTAFDSISTIKDLASKETSVKELKEPENIIKPVEGFANVKLSIRQNKILSLVLELEETGPAKIAKELGFSLSTSYRELVFLENEKLLTLAASGKRRLSAKGKKYLEYYLNNS
jgi:hypothetical protein